MFKNQIPSRLVRSVLILGMLIAGYGVVSPAVAQSAEQLDTFRNLTPEQQRAVMEAMQGRQGESVRPDRPLDFPVTVQPRSRDEQDREQNEFAREDGRPRLSENDTILLHLEIKQYEDQNVPVRPESLMSGQEQVGQAPARPHSAAPAQQPTQAVRAGEQAPEVRTPIIRTEEVEQQLKALQERIHRRNPYKLDKWGILNVPELGPIPLAGLTVEEATSRLAAESWLREFVVYVTHLPLQPTGREALKPFGYDLFAGVPTTFAPATDIPVPAEYVVGPGDVIEVQLIGNNAGRYSLVVARDGTVDFPELGPIAVAGRRFDDVRSSLERRVSDQMIGAQASINLGELRSIRVFVLGDAEWPGSYTVSGLSTITNALFVSGGVKDVGSLRRIELKRGGKTITTLDLYDLLLRGDTTADVRLLPGDVIFVPPVGPTVSVAGEVRRPAIYELKGETRVEQLIAVAGGLTPSADPRLATIERVGDSSLRVMIDVNLSTADGKAQRLRSGDVLQVPAIRPIVENSITLSGHVYRPGQFQYHQGMRLTDLISTLDELKPNADKQYVLVRRELPPDRRITVFSANIEQAFLEPTSAANFELAPRDQVHVFDLESGRDRIIQPLLRELQLQAQIDEPTREVSIFGRVKVPGKYPLEPGMRLLDLLRAGGGLSEAAYGGQAELTRYTIDENGARIANLIELDLRGAIEGDSSQNLPLHPFDYVVIKEVPLWASQEEVEIRGEVRFPGRYPISRGETLSSLLERAGGLTDFAFAEGAIFTRSELKEREREQLETLANRMQSDLTQLSLQAAQETGRDAGQALAVGQSLLANLRSTDPVGRLVIDIDRVQKTPLNSRQDVILKGGDMLLVPRVTQEVTVIGEVQSSTSHLFDPDLSRDDYIAMSGGITPRGDDENIYVVRANGSVQAKSSKAWFSGGVDIKPGDTIVVPLDTERMRPLPFWTAVTQIIYHLAISAAAVNSF